MNEMRNGGASLEIWTVTWSGCVNVNDFCYNQEKFILILLKKFKSPEIGSPCRSSILAIGISL